MKSMVWQRLDLVARMFTPSLIAVALVIVSVLPLHIPSYSPVIPSLALMAVYYWVLHRPDLLPAIAVFLVGILHDILTGGPLGRTSTNLARCLLGDRLAASSLFREIVSRCLVGLHDDRCRGGDHAVGADVTHVRHIDRAAARCFRLPPDSGDLSAVCLDVRSRSTHPAAGGLKCVQKKAGQKFSIDGWR